MFNNSRNVQRTFINLYERHIFGFMNHDYNKTRYNANERSIRWYMLNHWHPMNS